MYEPIIALSNVEWTALKALGIFAAGTLFLIGVMPDSRAEAKDILRKK